MDKFIRVLNFNIEFTQIFRGEILQVEGNDHVRLAVYGRCENMAVIGVWQL